MYKVLILDSQQHPICHLLKQYPWLLWKKKALFVFGLKIAELHAVEDAVLLKSLDL